MVRQLCSRLISIWKKLGMLIGDTIARVALLFVFWGAVAPMSFVWKLIKKDPMTRLWNFKQNSYFKDSEVIGQDHWERLF